MLMNNLYEYLKEREDLTLVSEPLSCDFFKNGYEFETIWSERIIIHFLK